MRALITYLVDGEQVDQYEPVKNPIACFMGFAESEFATRLFPPYYGIHLKDREPLLLAGSSQLSEWLRDTHQQHEITYMRAYSETASLGEDTYIELKPLP